MKQIFQTSVFSFFVCCLTYINGFAQQNETYRPAKIIAPSPTAASLGQYGEISVGYYSGNPDINIPIYNLITSNHSVPVTMRYNYTGAKVTEVASWVGLGWSLSAGGLITRSVIGLDDFGNNGYYNSGALPPNNNPPALDDINYYKDILSGFKDGEPDIFNYNFGKYSGKFVLGKKIDGSPVLMDDRNNLKITYQESTSAWLVITPDGYKYYLGTHEYVDDYYYDSEIVEVSENEPLSSFTRNISSSPTTSWYLDSIISPNKEVVKFNYLVKSNSLSLINTSEAYYRLLSVNGGCSIEIPGEKRTYNTTRQVIYDVYLTSIESKLGSIEFNTSDRDDIKYVSTSKPKKLSDIVVKNSKGIILRRFEFLYDYFSGPRLKLNSIKEYGQSGVSKPPYVFTYHAPNSLPSMYSAKSIDHWGYYNDKPNGSLLPSFLVQSSEPFYVGSANRQSNIDDEVIKKGILTSITYPTGGSTVYDYEMNVYSNLGGEDRYNYIPKSAQVYNYPQSIPGSPYRPSDTFTITDTVAVTINYNWLKADENANSLEGLQSTYGSLRKEGQISPVFTFEVWNCSSYSASYCTSAETSPESITLTLHPGVYTLYIEPLQGYITSANAFWNDKVRIYERKAGGLRIKSITNYSNNNVVEKRKFLYTDAVNKTTGVLIFQPKYNFRTIYSPESEMTGCPIIAEYIALMSNSVYTYGLSPATIIGYDKVTELLGENGENGKNEYFYLNSPGYPSYFPFIPITVNSLNGKVYRSINYASNGNIIKKVDYLYDIKESMSLTGVKLYQPVVANPFKNSIINFSHYYNSSTWVVLSQEKETYYNNNIENTKIKNFFFGNSNHKELTREQLIGSSNVSKEVNYKYPHDVSPPTAVSQRLIADGKIATVLEQSQSKGSATSKFNNQFSLNLAPFSLLESVTSSSTIDNTEEYRLRYHAYDKYGNVSSVSQEQGPKTCYLWSYGGQYPIAKIENADINMVLSILGGNSIVDAFRDKLFPTDIEVKNFLSKLRSDSYFNNALVSTYTYEPLVGITSETDPKGKISYYEYDELQRLKYIKDQVGNIVKSQDYNYKP